MRHRGELRYSPFKAQIIHHDHFTALSSQANDDISSNILNIQIELDLDLYNFPDDSELSLMVKCGTEEMVHVDLGTVVHWQQPSEVFDFGGATSSVKVRLSVTPKGVTHYQGYTDWRTCFPGKLESLIRPAYEDLGQIIWLFRINESDWPTIVLNSKASQRLAMMAAHDDIFIGQIFPQCIYSGFLHIAKNNFQNINQENEGLWENAWWRFALECLPDETESISSEENEAEVDRWAKELAVQFSKSRKFHDKFLKSLNKAGN